MLAETIEKGMEVDSELKKLIKVWVTVMLCLSYCYYIVSKLIPKGLLRLVSILPVCYLFIILPLTLHTFHISGPTIFFLVWLGIFKLLLFSFDIGPLSSPPPPSLFHFISLACLPIKIKPDPDPNPNPSQKPKNPIGQTNKSVLLLLALKALLLGLIIQTYEYRSHLHPYVILFLYCCHMYLGLEIVLAICAAPARSIFAFELEPQFNEPYLSTSLQDFWGRRWNLMVTNILRLTVYDPVRRLSTCAVGAKWARFLSVMCTFAVSGLMHEVIYYYLTRVEPTWEVTWFFLLHGLCVAAEVEVKKAVGGGGKWTPVSGPLTLVFLAVTGNWLFFPQLLRNGVDTKAIEEYAIIKDFLRAHLTHMK